MMQRLFLAVVLVSAFGVVDAQQSLNLAMIKRDTQVFERIVSEVLTQNFASPFAITAEPKGAYLQGYGISISFQLNINRARLRTPYGYIKAPSSMGQMSKEQQIKLVRETMVQCLADYGRSVKQLGPHDRITIQAYIEDRNELDPAKSSTILVLSVLKDDINLLATSKISPEAFKERVSVLMY
jgi:hypothetical protein